MRNSPEQGGQVRPCPKLKLFTILKVWAINIKIDYCPTGHIVIRVAGRPNQRSPGAGPYNNIRAVSIFATIIPINGDLVYYFYQ